MTTVDTRGRRSARSPLARISEDTVVQMRERYAAGETMTALAAEHGMSLGHVSKIINGIRWPYAGGPIPVPGQRTGRRGEA